MKHEATPEILKAYSEGTLTRSMLEKELIASLRREGHPKKRAVEMAKRALRRGN